MVVLVVRVLNPSNALLSDPKKDVKEKLPYPLIIGASCGGIFVIVLASICLVRHCHRQERIENRRVSNGMPPEVPHPSPHNYELKETRSKEDIVNYEELGVWKDTGMYEKLHFSNGETRYQELGSIIWLLIIRKSGNRMIVATTRKSEWLTNLSAIRRLVLSK